MTTTNQTSYKSGTAQQILQTTEPAGTLAFATDTNHLMISNGTTWAVNTLDRVEGKSYTTGTFSDFTETPIVHIDASVDASVESRDGTQSADGDQVYKWKSQVGGLEFRATDGRAPSKTTLGGNAAVYSSYNQVMSLMDPLAPARGSHGEKAQLGRKGSFTVITVFTPVRHPVYSTLPDDGIGWYEKRDSISPVNHVNDADRMYTTSWNTNSPTKLNNPWLIEGLETEAYGTNLGGRYQAGKSRMAFGSSVYRNVYSTGGNVEQAGSDQFGLFYYDYNSTNDSLFTISTSHTFYNNEARLNSTPWTRDYLLTPDQDIENTNTIPQSWNWNGNFLGRPQMLSQRINGEESSNSNESRTDITCLHTYNNGINGYGNFYDSTGATHGGIAGPTTFNGSARVVNKVGTRWTSPSEPTRRMDELNLFARYTSAANPGVNDIGIHEMIVFPYILSDSEINAYGEHLKTKWSMNYYASNCINNYPGVQVSHAGY